ncbi:unnamed protein product [Didymodactylos carnosus]|uniref:Reverse transcriptase domain-containing protein n=1 Tax=Didymodactylos carnosus TaxID=1234261 RepID=A0A8S2ERA7_9BILA|nr:unnamed protein product [Didymodactylos carnosus]CAF4026747.1 unnamed protein product [Didymodactylos carnosus]
MQNKHSTPFDIRIINKRVYPCIMLPSSPSTVDADSYTTMSSSGPKALVNKYRPVSLLSILSKVLERFIYDELVSYSTKHNFFSPVQFGFRQKSSTTDALIYLTHKIQDKLEADDDSILVTFDFEKAFNRVPYQILLTKLNALGIKEQEYTWFKSYLTKRKQRVRVGSCVPTLADVPSGVPQGSVLGPLL